MLTSEVVNAGERVQCSNTNSDHNSEQDRQRKATVNKSQHKNIFTSPNMQARAARACKFVVSFWQYWAGRISISEQILQ